MLKHEIMKVHET